MQRHRSDLTIFDNIFKACRFAFTKLSAYNLGFSVGLEVVIALLMAFFTFFLYKKVTKKSRRFDARLSDGGRFSLTNCRWGVIYSKGLRLENPLRVIRRFLKALYFSPNVYSYLMLYLVKNKALDEFSIEELALPLN